MDFSVVAAVGSFVVSERVLKPKATALFILGCLLVAFVKFRKVRKFKDVSMVL